MKIMKSKLTQLAFLGLLATTSAVYFSEKSNRIQAGEIQSFSQWEALAADTNQLFENLIQAFEAYEKSEFYEEGADKHFREWKRSASARLRANGTIMGVQEYNERFLAYRNPLAFSQDSLVCDNRTQVIEEDFENIRRGRVLAAPEVAGGPGSVYSGIANPNGAGDWKRVGPFGDPEVKWSATGNGRIMYLAYHPTQQNVLYAATSHAGLWKTTNGGKNWITLTDALPGRGTSTIAIDPTDSKTLYLGSGSTIYKSTDEGVSWVNSGSGLGSSPFDIKINPNNNNVLLTNTSKGIYRSTDAGSSWTQIKSGDFRNMDVLDDWSLIVAIRENSTHQFYKSTDAGVTWDSTSLSKYETIIRPHLGLYKPDAEATNQNPRIYVMLEGVKGAVAAPSTKYAGLYRSDDLGVTFSEVLNPDYTYNETPMGIQNSHPDSANYSEIADGYGTLFGNYLGWFTNGFSINPKNPDHLLFPATKFWGSLDGGASWVSLPSYGGSNWADQHFSSRDLSGDTLLWVNDGGLWAMAYEDMWKPSHSQYVFSKNGDMASSLSSQCDISRYNKNVHISGGQDIGQIFHRKGRDSHVASADVYRGRIAPHNDSAFLTGNLMVMIGDSSVSINNQIRADYHDSRRMYGFSASSSDPWLVRSPAGKDAWQFGNKTENKASAGGHSTTPIDDVKNWQKLDFAAVGLTTLKSPWFEQSHANANIAFLGDGNSQKIVVTHNLNDSLPTWTALANAPLASSYKLATHPYNENILFVGTSSDIYISFDKGQSFEVLGNFPDVNPIKIIADKRKSSGAYVLTERSVYYIDETLENWTAFNKGLPLTGYNDMHVYWSEDNDHRLYVSNYGRGVLSSSLYTPAGENAPLVADFGIHGMSQSIVALGDSVRLFDLSTHNTESRNWKLTNGSTTLTASNVETPSFQMNTPGFYSVSLKVSAGIRSDSILKKHYIEVLDTVKLAECTPDSATGVWYKGIGKVVLNGDEHSSGGTGSSKYSDFSSTKIFKVYKDSSQNLEVYSSNDNFTNYDANVYVDMNNNGSFEDSELVASSEGRNSDEYIFDFVLDSSTVVNTPVRMRVLYHEGTMPDSACYSASGEVEDYSLVVKLAPPQITLNVDSLLIDEVRSTVTLVKANTVFETGVVYSKNNPNPDINSVGKVVTTASIVGSGTYSIAAVDLEKNTSLYVRAYLVNAEGVHYGEVQNVELESYVLPLFKTAEAVYDDATGKWTVGGSLNPQSNAIDSLFIQYGDGLSHSISESVNSSSYVGNSWFDVSFEIDDLPPFSSVFYRLRAVVDGEVFYSQIKRFNSEKDLFAYWDFEGGSADSVLDKSGNSRHGILSGARIGTDGSGKFGGKGLILDDINDLVSLNLGELDPPFTVSFWAKKTAENGTSYSTIFEGTSGYRLEMGTWNSTHKVGIAKNGKFDDNSGFEAPLDEWHHYVFVGDIDTVTMYLDGSVQKTYARNYKLPLKSIGKSGRSMIGVLDEIKVYSKLIEVDEITELEKQNQSISFAAISDKTEGDNSFELVSSTNSGLAITYEIVKGIGLVSIVGSTVTLESGVGEVVIRAKQAGDSVYFATWVEQSFNINAEVISSSMALSSSSETIDAVLGFKPQVDAGLSKQSLWVNSAGLSSATSLRVLTATAQAVWQGNLGKRNSKVHFDVSLESGVYYLRISDRGFQTVKRFVVK